jgi:hypothetical protein
VGKRIGGFMVSPIVLASIGGLNWYSDFLFRYKVKY